VTKEVASFFAGEMCKAIDHNKSQIYRYTCLLFMAIDFFPHPAAAAYHL